MSLLVCRPTCYHPRDSQRPGRDSVPTEEDFQAPSCCVAQASGLTSLNISLYNREHQLHIEQLCRPRNQTQRLTRELCVLAAHASSDRLLHFLTLTLQRQLIPASPRLVTPYLAQLNLLIPFP